MNRRTQLPTAGFVGLKKTITRAVWRFASTPLLALAASLCYGATNIIGGPAAMPSIAAGQYHTVILKADGGLWAWGRNSSGQLGDGTTTDSLLPKQIGTGFIAISSGYDSNVALKADGSLWAWGNNLSGQLGDGTINPILAPKLIDTGYATVATTADHTVALKSDGSLWAWGSNSAGQLGDGTTTQSLVPKRIGSDIYTAIAAGYYQTVALKADGSLWIWGYNDDGGLGDGTTSPIRTPKQIGVGYAAISAGEGYRIALKSDGSLWVWGSNRYAQPGDGSSTVTGEPKQIGSDYAAVSAGGNHAVALKNDGSLWAWGDNSYGQLGWGTTTGGFVPKRVGIATYGAIAAGSYHSVALKPDGSFWTWGSNYFGSLGDGATSDGLVPKQIDVRYTPDVTAPSIPTGLSATSTGATQGYLTWNVSTDDVGVSRYEIYRDGVLIGSPTGPYLSETGLAPSTAYRYTMAACDAAGNCSARSVAISLTTPAPAGTPSPPAPTELTVTDIGAAQALLVWTSPAGSVDVAQYKIYRSIYNIFACVSAPGTVCASVSPRKELVTSLSGSPPQTSYVDLDLLPATQYSYEVHACGTLGNCTVASGSVFNTQAMPIPSIRTPPAAACTPYGPLTNQTLRIAMIPPTDVRYLSAGTFVAALPAPSMGGGAYLMSADGSWTPFTTCGTAPAVQLGKPGVAIQLDIVPAPMDLSELKGTSVYVGYGIGTTAAAACADMLNNMTFTLANTLGESPP